MKRFLALLAIVAIGAALGVFGAVACGPGEEKPPLTPDSEHVPNPDGPEGGTPAPTPGGSPATPPGK
jgi:hypothetical protein